MVSYEGSDDAVIRQTSQSDACCAESSADCRHSTAPCCAGDGTHDDDTLKIAWRYKNLHLPVQLCLTIGNILL